jgi:HSP20 family protein
MDRFFGGTFPDFGWDRRWSAPRLARGLGLSQIQWSPSMEILERDNELVIRADLPGLSKDDINVEVTDDMLTIAGERREERDETREGYRHSERRYGRFSRSFPLPEGINAEDVKAAFQNGVLEVTMPAPKREQRGRRIEIQEGAGESARPSSEQPKTTQ